MIPVCEPTLADKEKEYATDCLETGWISSTGKYIKKFEEAFADFCGTKYCVSCCNGTAALHLTIAALGISEGDEVIMPCFTMIATCNAVIYTGATPVLIDSELKTWNMDASRIEEAITDRTRAILVVHTYGHPVDMEPILGIAEKYDIPIIEDAAEAHGAEYKGKRCGNLGMMAAFSFYGNKILTTGEGGAVTTSDSYFAKRLNKLKNHYFGIPRFVHHEVGFNYRLTNIQAAIGLAQIEIADKLVEMRRENALEYNKRLAGIHGIQTPPEAEWAKNVYWMYGILLGDDFPLNRDETMDALKRKGIETRAFFHPMHLQPVYKSKKIKNRPVIRGPLPIAEHLGARGLYLPSSSHLTIDQIRAVTSAIRIIAEGGL